MGGEQLQPNSRVINFTRIFHAKKPPWDQGKPNSKTECRPRCVFPNKYTASTKNIQRKNPLPHIHKNTPLFNTHLESRASINQQLLEISIEPRPRLGRRFHRRLLPTSSIISNRTRIRRPITLTTRLHPHKRIYQGIASVARRTSTEPGTAGIAPITLLDLTGGLHARAALVDDEFRVGPAVGGEDGGEGVDEAFLVAVGVGGGVRGTVKHMLVIYHEEVVWNGGIAHQVARDQAL